MSDILNIYDESDLPCNDWLGSAAQVDDCPMRDFWREGEVRMCSKCGWQIGFNLDENEDHWNPVFGSRTNKYFGDE